MLLWVVGELSFDRFHANGERLYRVYVNEVASDGSTDIHTSTPAPFGPALAESTLDIESVTRCTWGMRMTVRRDTEDFLCESVRAVDTSFLKMFTFKAVMGTTTSALSVPDGIVLTEATARRFFGDENPLGRTLVLDNNGEHQVTAVVEDIPAVSHLTFECLIPFESMTRFGYNLDDWGRFSFTTYALLRSGADLGSVSGMIEPLLQERLTELSIKVLLQPLFDIRLHSDHISGSGGGNLQLVLALSVAALVVLVVACINFVNLATARATRRSREIGLRKVVGALKRQLVVQLMLESLFAVVLSLAVALMLVELVLPSVTNLAGRTVGFEQLETFELVLGLIVFVVVTSLMAGFYPAMIAASSNPIKLLGKTSRSASGGSRLRKTLVVAQFGFSMFLGVMTLVVWHQLNFVRAESMAAFDSQDCTVTMRLGSDSRDELQVLKQALLSLPEVQNVSASSWLPNHIRSSFLGADWEGKDPNSQIPMYAVETDGEFVETYGLEISQGRFFSDTEPTDGSKSVVINEAAARIMGMDDPIGRPLRFYGDYRIIGVLKDFHFASLYNQIEPLLVFGELERPRYLTVKFHEGDLAGSLHRAGQVWNELVPGEVFEYGFLDEVLTDRYAGERAAGTLIMWFAGIAVLVACLGLFGLSTYATQRRLREIGIRRALGASGPSVVGMLCGEYARLVVIAALFAFPAAYLVSDAWLSSFAYRITPGIAVFGTVMFVSVVVTALAITWPAVRAAGSNPIKALRYE
jgi:putative ABC transport system permease protein